MKPDESIAWLSSLVLSSPDASGASGARGDDIRRDRVAKTAMSAIALHDVPAADRALESFVAPTPARVAARRYGVLVSGSARGDAGARRPDARMIAEDPSEKVRSDKVTFGLSVSETPAALTTLLNTAKNDQSRKVRGQALFWLRAARRQGSAGDHLRRDRQRSRHRGEEEGGASRSASCRADEGVPKLIEVARSNRNPRCASRRCSGSASRTTRAR